jgi:hypothetical protein
MKDQTIIEKFIADVDIPEMTVGWLNSWAARASSEEWNDQQLYYLIDTALVHATIWGDLDTTGLAELHRREQFMGLNFAKEEATVNTRPKITKLAEIQQRRAQRAEQAKGA